MAKIAYVLRRVDGSRGRSDCRPLLNLSLLVDAFDFGGKMLAFVNRFEPGMLRIEGLGL